MQTQRMYIIVIVILLFSFGITQAQDATVNGYAPDGTYTYIHVSDTDASITITPELAHEVTGSNLWIEPLDDKNFDVTIQDGSGDPRTVYHSGMLGYSPVREVTIYKDGVQTSDLKLTYQLCRHYTFDIRCVNFVLNLYMDGKYELNAVLTTHDFGYVTDGGFMTYFPVQEPMFPFMIDDVLNIGTISIVGKEATIYLSDPLQAGFCFEIRSERTNNRIGQTFHDVYSFGANEEVTDYSFEIPTYTYHHEGNTYQTVDINIGMYVTNCTTGEEIFLTNITNPTDPMGWGSAIPESSEGMSFFMPPHSTTDRSGVALDLMSLPALRFRTSNESVLDVWSVYTNRPDFEADISDVGVQITNMNWFAPAPGHISFVDSEGIDLTGEIAFNADIIVSREALETLVQGE